MQTTSLCGDSVKAKFPYQHTIMPSRSHASVHIESHGMAIEIAERLRIT
jgi:hypothetical protein